jgi:hypothetical protein
MIELLVAMLLSGVALGVAATDFSHTVHQRHDMDQVAEAQQAVSASLTFVTQELRQAGACLPRVGRFVALEGEDSAERDRLTMRIGVTDRETLVCIRSVAIADAAEGTDSIAIQDASGFAVGHYVYVTRFGGQGNTFRVAGIDGDTLVVEGTLDATYLTGSGVYAIEERAFAIDSSGPSPVLTMAVDGGEPQPLARGIDVFNVRYLLGPCSPCTAVDEPTDNAEWQAVREVEITVAAATRGPLQTGKPHVVEESTNVKPRNLI